MTSFNINDYEPDVQQYMFDEWAAADNPMYRGEVYINTRGKVYRVLEDSMPGESYVKVEIQDKFGKYTGYRPKIILIS